MTTSKIPDFQEIIALASSTYFANFKSYPNICGCAPGRVNLIGEHTDYNDGFVLPMALPMVTVVVGAANNSHECHIFTVCPAADDPRDLTFSLTSNKNTIKPGNPLWANYIKGVMANFKGKLVGFNAVIGTSVPVGGGLSSSAALEVATYCFLEDLTNEHSASLIDKALACQKAEHEFLNMPCGIMDQFISVMAKKDHALLLDCRSLQYEMIFLQDTTITILITNTNIKHKLAESQYSNRKKQCEIASKIIGKDSLRDVTLEDLQSNRELLGKEVYSRAFHVVTEIQRTIDAAKAIKKGNYTQFGTLMTQSHQSLRDNYEVSCPELDTVVNAALEVEGVYGSRMTGGGFGGCTVTLLNSDVVDKAIENIQKKYENATFYVCRPADGAKSIQMTNI